MTRRLTPAPGGPRRISPNLFGISFGLAGLAGAWHAVGPLPGVPDGYW